MLLLFFNAEMYQLLPRFGNLLTMICVCFHVAISLSNNNLTPLPQIIGYTIAPHSRHKSSHLLLTKCLLCAYALLI